MIDKPAGHEPVCDYGRPEIHIHAPGAPCNRFCRVQDEDIKRRYVFRM